jgi:DNA polymerase
MTDAELREELLVLSGALRAHAEWQLATGAVGLPSGKLPEEVLARAEQWAAPVESQPSVPEPPTSLGLGCEDRREGLPAAPAPEPAPELARGFAEAAAVEVATATAAPEQPRPPAAAPRPPAPEQREESPAARAALASVDLEALRVAVADCTACRLHETRTQTVFARGTGSSGLCFVGEGPGADEDAQGYPFVGAAGQLLDRMILAMGFERDAVYVCNIVKCRPPNNRKPQPDEMSACRPHFERQLELLKPQVIVALGATAVEGLFGTTIGITKLRGHWKVWRGSVPVMPTFHPAYLLRNPAAKREVWEDLQSVVQRFGRSLPQSR